FINTLNFTTASSITDVEFDRFCTHILPQTHHYMKKLILEPTSMERILLLSDYTNLTYLEIFNFEEESTHYFIDNSVLGHIFKHKMTDLILHNNDDYTTPRLLITYNNDLYAHIFFAF
ncbi:unnamed protein product, partial [Rotaria magnacalcarata]